MDSKIVKNDLLNLTKINETLSAESDRGAAIYATALTDEHLKILLKEIFGKDRQRNKVSDELFEGYGPFTSLAAKAATAYSMGFLGSDVYADISIMRKIRNRFAHESDHLTFSDSTIQNLMKNLKFTDSDNSTFNDMTIQERSRLRFSVVTAYVLGYIDTSIMTYRVNSDGKPIWHTLLSVSKWNVGQIKEKLKTSH